ncbi:hypothetical protein Tco_0204364 [Tanacetum coccineum]
MLASIDNDPLVYPTIEENRQTRPKKYSELTEAQQLQDDCDVQATNIILHGLPPDVYALINHQEAANNKYQSITMFLNALPSEWSKFITDVKYPDSLAFVANSPTLYNPSQSPQHLGNRGIGTTSKGNVAVGPLRVVKCYNCQGEGICRELVYSQKGKNAAWFYKEEIDNSAFLTDDLDAYASDCDDLSLAKVVLMANISSYDPQVLYKAQRIQPTVYDGSVLAKEHDVISVYNDEETLILEEESRSKMLDKKMIQFQ